MNPVFVKAEEFLKQQLKISFNHNFFLLWDFYQVGCNTLSFVCDAVIICQRSERAQKWSRSSRATTWFQ